MLQASDLTKAYDGAPLFDGLSFVLADGERAGLVGRGHTRPQAVGRWVGKSTLLRLLAGVRAGAVALRSARRLGAGGRARRGAACAGHRAPRPGHAAGAALGGEQARALLAGTLLAGPTVLLLDEPTNHLDGDGLRWLEDWLRGFAGTVVVVSHDRAFLDAVVGCILELEPGGALTRYEGGYSDHRVERERRRAKLALEYEAQEKRRRRLEADIATTRRQAQHTERTAGGLGSDQLKRYARKAKAREGRPRRELEGDGAVAVTGPNRAGKTTLLDVLSGVLVPAAGTVELAGAVRMLPQTPIALPAQERVVDWLRAQAALDEGAARTLLGAFALDTAAVHRPLGRLSPGERARVHMAAMVASGAELLLLDEPTNHLDPETLEAVEAALRAFGGTIVAVSHDRAFLDGLGVTRRLEVRDGRVLELA
jgi:ATPase subunit of ABC transporter with duplicated ATPase domains